MKKATRNLECSHIIVLLSFISLFLAFCSSLDAGTKKASEVSKAGTTAAQDSAKENSAPCIQFEESSYDFGKAKQNTSLKHTFVFKNTGSAVLHIKKVKAT